MLSTDLADLKKFMAENTGAVIEDADVAAARMVRLVTEGVIEAIDGSEVRLAADTVCVHSDTPGAVDIATAVVRQLTAAGVTIRPVGRAA